MRTYKRINDIYEVQLADCKKYFQFVQTDSSLLGGDIIVIYSRKYDKNESPIIEDIVKDTIEYCCHTCVSRGIKEGLWRKYGNGPIYIDLSNTYFRNYVNEPCLGIQGWHIWKANAPYGNLSRNGVSDELTYSLCKESLANQGNYYNLHKAVADDGRIIPIAFFGYAVYATRGLLTDLTPTRDNVFAYSLGKTMDDVKAPMDMD